MEIKGGPFGKMNGLGVSLVALLLANMGCGSAQPESVTRSEQALGSTKPRVDISNWTGLTAMVSDGNYRLTADINASGKTWTPQPFSGTFDGNGRTISNLTMNIAGDAGFFSSISNAIVKNVKFTNLSVTGTFIVGGVAGYAEDSSVDRAVVEGTITATNGFAVGGLVGEMVGGTIFRSYAKGTVRSAIFYNGGLVGFLGESSTARASIIESYAQATVTATTTDPTRVVNAGGLVGRAFAPDIHDVYAVGNVTGRGGVGGLVGYLDGSDVSPWILYKGVYRGDVVDRNAPTGGWAGTVGGFADFIARWENCVWDSQLDPSSNYIVHSVSQLRGNTNTLRSNATPSGGIYGTGDNGFSDPPWNAGTSSQHHTLRNMPGPNVQPL